MLKFIQQMAPSTLSQLQGTTFFLLKKTFGKENELEMDLNTFRETIKQFIETDERYLHFFINTMMKKRHFNEALYWSNLYGLNHIRKNVEHRAHLDAQHHGSGQHHHSHYQLPLDYKCIHFISDSKQFKNAFQEIMKSDVAGFDSEWPANVLPNSNNNSLSIMQIALKDKVFIIDIENLASQMSKEHWMALKNFITSRDMLKFTFAGNNDLLMLQKSYSKQLGTDWKDENFVDLQNLIPPFWEALRVRGVQSLSSEPTSLQASPLPFNPPLNLSQVARLFLGRPIKKHFRLSNWSRRPLDRDQMLYAAIDAFSLIEIHEKIVQLIQSHDLFLPRLLYQPNDTSGIERSKTLLLLDHYLLDIAQPLRSLGFEIDLILKESCIDELIRRAKNIGGILVTVLHHLQTPKAFTAYRNIIALPLLPAKGQIEYFANCVGRNFDFESVQLVEGNMQILQKEVQNRQRPLMIECEINGDTVFKAKVSAKNKSQSYIGMGLGKSKSLAESRGIANLLAMLK